MQTGYIASITEMAEDTRPKLVIDMRTETDYHTGSLPGARNVFWQDFPKETSAALRMLAALSEVSNDAMQGHAAVPVYLICYTGDHSAEAAERLREAGIEAWSVEGGYASYLRYEMKRLLSGAAAGETAEEAPDGEPGGTEGPTGAVTDAAAAGTVLDGYRETPAARVVRLRAEKSIQKTFRKELWRRFTKAVKEYELIRDGDRIAVCISGGKDSMLMAKLFQELERHGIHNFSCVYLVMDPGYNDINREMVLNNARLLGIPAETFRTEIYDIVAEDAQSEEAKSPCYLCARMRRGYLYKAARDRGCNKIALGHHLDDVIETTVMSMFCAGQIQTMMPKLRSAHFEGMELIRPLYLIREHDIIRWRDYNGLHFINCACRLTESCASCGGTEKGSKRAEVKRLIAELEKKDPYVAMNIFRSMQNVSLSMVLGYRDGDREFDFLSRYGSGGGDREQH